MDKHKVYLYSLLSSALIQIREDAHENRNKKVFWISNLLHNLPKQLLDENVNYEEILNELKSKAAHDQIDRWLENELDSTSEQYGL